MRPRLVACCSKWLDTRCMSRQMAAGGWTLVACGSRWLGIVCMLQHVAGHCLHPAACCWALPAHRSMWLGTAHHNTALRSLLQVHLHWFLAAEWAADCSSMNACSLPLYPSALLLQVRLKRFLEMRGADGGPWRMICALPALWVGLIYEPQAQAEALQLVSSWSQDDRDYLGRGERSWTGFDRVWLVEHMVVMSSDL
eukprot:GHRQ01039148.1.p1 GENE.GHRQ01039148.1~~GHRQ01039148.1.p1  ORF type:complete len:197 (-),score=56.82 GHRQ01039148.1:39-629(-)